MNYKLYTDASRRMYDGQPLCVIAGYLLDEKNRPVFEFVLEQPPAQDTEYLEMLALKTGIELAYQVGVKNLMCYSDNLNTVKIIKKPEQAYSSKAKQWKKYTDLFHNFKVEYIPREYNCYANALAKLPFNIRLKKNTLLAYHGINRSKKRFYEKLKNCYVEDIHNFEKPLKEAIYFKFQQIQQRLENLSDHDNQYVEQNFKRFYTYFNYLLHINNKAKLKKEEKMLSFRNFLDNTTICKSVWPSWIQVTKSSKLEPF